MAKTVTLLFEGVNVSENFLTGTISSKEIIESYTKHWIPPYQRERIQNKRKINNLIEIFRTTGHIDAVKLSIRGSYTTEGDHLLIEGEVSIIDGQQRVMALLDSGVRGIKIPVELYINISLEEEIKLFHQYNRAATKLTFGELAKSIEGSYALLLRKLLRRGESYPVPITINSTYTGLSFSVIAGLLNYIERFLIQNVKLSKFNAGKHLLSWLEQDQPMSEVNMVDFAMRNILELLVQIAGTFDVKAVAYRRGVVQAFTKVMVKNFLQDTGKLNLGKFEARVLAMQEKLFQNARFKETASQGSAGGGELRLEIMMIQYLNHNLKQGHLPEPNIFTDDETVEQVSFSAEKFNTPLAAQRG